LFIEVVFLLEPSSIYYRQAPSIDTPIGPNKPCAAGSASMVREKKPSSLQACEGTSTNSQVNQTWYKQASMIIACLVLLKGKEVGHMADNAASAPVHYRLCFFTLF
jgi:hypothetical protein